QLGIAAVWAAPVIAVVATAPLAAASPNSADKSVLIAGQANTAGPTTIEGAFTRAELEYDDGGAPGTYSSGIITATAFVESVPAGPPVSASFNSPGAGPLVPYAVNDTFQLGGG